MKKRVVATILAASLGILAVGCGNNAPAEPEQASSEVLEAVIEPTAPAEEVPAVIEATEAAPEEVPVEIPDGMAVNKLTGEWIDEGIASQKPFACMIENGDGDLPFYGLSKADIIYEALAESNITRMMGIWQDYESIDKIGTVRSCRSYYAAASKEYDAFYGHWGLSLFAVPTLSTMKGYDMDGMGGSASYPKVLQDNSPNLSGGILFDRESGRSSVHSVYATGARVASTIEKYDTYTKESTKGLGPHFNFANPNETVTLDSYANAEDAVVAVPGGYTDKKRYFIYDDSTGLYMAYQKGAKQMDECYGAQLSAKNLIFQDCTYSIYSGIDSDYDSHKYKNIQLSGKGKGYYVTEGKAIPITWEKAGDDTDGEVTHYYDEDGNEITVNTGTTWISIVLPEYDTYSSRPTAFYASEADFQ